MKLRWTPRRGVATRSGSVVANPEVTVILLTKRNPDYPTNRVTDPVGTLITERPPDRSVHARLRIRLL